MSTINTIVAMNVKALREERRLSLDALAAMTGVSKSMLGMIERGAANPTITTLWKIAHGLKVPFSRFMTHVEDAVEVQSIRDIQPLLPDDADGYRNYPLFPVDDSRPFEVYYIEIDPNGAMSSDPHPPETQEIITVFSGALELTIGERVELLASGNSIRFHADIGHAYRNPGAEICRVSMIVAYSNAT